jgi:hypothetical protein
MGGLAGADAFCQRLAANAGLPGTYMAWLSAGNQSPQNRFLTRSSLPYNRVDGTKIANNWANLTNGRIAAPINVTETGKALESGQFVWTNTLANGRTATTKSDCLGWTTDNAMAASEFGDSNKTDATWSATDRITNCNNTFPLYCFQQSE